LPLDAIRRPPDTPLWKLEVALKCQSCRKGHYARPVHMIKLHQEREIAAYVWVHPGDVDRRSTMTPARAYSFLTIFSAANLASASDA
jgi:hypothetical protein